MILFLTMDEPAVSFSPKGDSGLNRLGRLSRVNKGHCALSVDPNQAVLPRVNYQITGDVFFGVQYPMSGS